jgi:predicted site-specific integrase-resolvase
MNGWARIKEGAKHSGVKERTFRDWLKAGLKHSRLPSGTILIRYSWIDEFLEKYQVNENQVQKIVDQTVKEIQGER